MIIGIPEAKGEGRRHDAWNNNNNDETFLQINVNHRILDSSSPPPPPGIEPRTFYRLDKASTTEPHIQHYLNIFETQNGRCLPLAYDLNAQL